MKILVLNSGSSSVKFQIIQKPENKVLAKGLVEKIGLGEGAIHYEKEDQKHSITLPIPNHAAGLEKAVSFLLDKEIGVIQDVNEIKIVGHRVVHGGNEFTQTTFINNDVKKKIKELFDLAPLHNPANLTGIEVAEKIFPNAQQVAVFDTTFHQSLPEKSYTYAIPLHLRDEKYIRKYGFHGISHQYVSKKANEFLGLNTSKIITIHLGNGCSMTAVKDGESFDHSLGFGPNEGLIMGTRSGAIDSSIIFYLQDQLGYSIKEINNLLSRESGMLGLTGFSDLREIEDAAQNGNESCELALEINAFRIKKYIGAYAAAMNGLDAIVFTAGIGENSDIIREKVCRDMDFFGIELNLEKNKIRSKEIRNISSQESKVKVLVIPTNEELQIANECYEISRE